MRPPSSADGVCPKHPATNNKTFSSLATLGLCLTRPQAAQYRTKNVARHSSTRRRPKPQGPGTTPGPAAGGTREDEGVHTPPSARAPDGRRLLGRSPRVSVWLTPNQFCYPDRLQGKAAGPGPHEPKPAGLPPVPASIRGARMGRTRLSGPPTPAGRNFLKPGFTAACVLAFSPRQTAVCVVPHLERPKHGNCASEACALQNMRFAV